MVWATAKHAAFDEQGEEGGPTYTVAERDLLVVLLIYWAKAWHATFLPMGNGQLALLLIPSWSFCRPGQARSRNSIAAPLNNIGIRCTGCRTGNRSSSPETRLGARRVALFRTLTGVSRGR